MLFLNYLSILVIGGFIFVVVRWVFAEKKDSKKSHRLLLGFITILVAFLLGVEGANLFNKVDDHYTSTFLSMTFKNLRTMLKHDQKEKVQEILNDLKNENRFDMHIAGDYFSKTKEIVKNIENDKTK